MFRAGLAIATLGLVWTLWPAPGAGAYSTIYRLGRSRYRQGPRVAIDLGHFNDSPTDYRFLALADLLTSDGYRVTRSRQYLIPEFLKDARLLVIGNPMPYPAGFSRLADWLRLSGRATLAPEELNAVHEWVRSGGSLLLEAYAPASARAATPLAAEFGLHFHDCRAPVFLPAAELGEHPILEGSSEHNEHVVSAAVLAGGWIESGTAASAIIPLLKAPLTASGVSGSCTAGKPLAVALEFGRGRVVALSAQLERDEDLVRRTGVDPRRADNRQFVLNTFHWLSRGID
jgi:hypothetical protein